MTVAFSPFQYPKFKMSKPLLLMLFWSKIKFIFWQPQKTPTSTYDDGEVLGSFIGALSLETFELTFIQKISETHKFEGLTLYSNSNEKLEFLLCEDKDTEILETAIYKLKLPT